MSVNTFTATPSLQALYPNGYQDALTLLNLDGLVNVYLCDRPGMAPTSGWLLSPQSSVTWNPGRPLYIACAPASTAPVQIIDQDLNGWNPGAIAGQLIDQNLPGLIANEISIQGAPPINAFDVLQHNNNSGIIAPGSFYTIDTNVSKYNSIRFNTDYVVSGASAGAPVIRPMRFDWYTGDPNIGSSILIDTEIYYVYHCINGSRDGTSVFAPTRGAWLRIFIQPEVVNTSPSGGFFDYDLIGTYQSLDRPVQFMGFYAFGSPSTWTIDPNNNADNSWTAFGAKTGGVIVTDYPPMQSGPNFLYVLTNAVTLGTLQIQLIDLITTRPLVGIWFNSGSPASNGSLSFIAPNKPLQINVGGSAAASTFVQISVSSEPR